MEHLSNEKQEVVLSVDRLIQRAQELSDSLVRFYDQVPSGEPKKPADIAAYDEVLTKLAFTWLTSRDAIATVATDVDVEGANSGGWDF